MIVCKHSYATDREVQRHLRVVLNSLLFFGRHQYLLEVVFGLFIQTRSTVDAFLPILGYTSTNPVAL